MEKELEPKYTNDDMYASKQPAWSSKQLQCEQATEGDENMDRKEDTK